MNVTKINRVVILCSNETLSNAIKHFMKVYYDIPEERFILVNFSHTSILFDILENLDPDDLWIIELFDPSDLKNPVGWRTGKKIPSKVFFISLLFPDDETIMEEKFIYFPCDEIVTKMNWVIENPRPNQEKFKEIENRWKRLQYKPEHHHHHG